MKRILLAIIAVASLFMIATSCNKEKVCKYDFIIIADINVANESAASEIKEMILSDSYFSETHSITATLSEALGQAAEEFEKHCKALDEDAISSKLQLNEYVRIALWTMNPGNCWMYYEFTPNIYAE